MRADRFAAERGQVGSGPGTVAQVRRSSDGRLGGARVPFHRKDERNTRPGEHSMTEGSERAWEHGR